MHNIEKSAVTFGIISDCQYTNEEDESYTIPSPEALVYNCSYRDSPQRLDEAIDFFNSQPLDFIVHLGDFIDRRNKEALILKKITTKALSPFWHVLGNHEYKEDPNTIESIVDMYDMPSRHYAKNIGDYRFLIIDSNELGIISNSEGSEDRKRGEDLIAIMKDQGLPNAYPWNGGVDEVQAKWMEEQIQDAEIKNQNVVIFSHHPVFPPGPLNMLNDNQILEMINKYSNIKAFFNGHNHLGNFGREGDVPYVTVAGIVEGEGNAYGIVNFDSSGKGILTGHGRQQSYDLT